MCGKCITLGYIGGPELVPRLSPTQNEAEVSIGREKCVSRIRQLSSAVGQKSIGSRLQLEAPDIEVSAELTDDTDSVVYVHQRGKGCDGVEQWQFGADGGWQR